MPNVKLRKMSKSQAGRLGGLAAADSLTAEERQLRASKAGSATKAAHSRDYFVRLALKRWGYNVKPGEKVDG